MPPPGSEFRTMLLRRRSSVEAWTPIVKLLGRRRLERFAGATSRFAFACWSSSANSKGRQASIMCHRT